jgi:hypothetical protein
MSFRDYFAHHLEDEIQNRYNLDDDEMEKLINYLQQFEPDGSTSLKKFRRRENRNHLEKVMQEILNKELEEDAPKDLRLDPVTQQDTLVYPMGLPLSQEMIIEPHYDGGYTF